MSNPMQNTGGDDEEFFGDSGEALDAAEETAAPAPEAAAPATRPASKPAAPPKSVPAGEGGRTYTVKPGDSLSKIAKALTGALNNWTKIHEANRDLIADPNVIHPGQTIRIPF